MYNMGEAFTTACEAGARRINTMCIINGSTMLTGDTNLVSLSYSEQMEASSGISMGGTAMSSVELTLRPPAAPIVWMGAEIKPYAGVWYGGVYHYCPLGVFWVTEVKTNTGGGEITLVAYDRMAKLASMSYTPAIQFPASVEDILDDLERQAGCLIINDTPPTLTIDTPLEGSVKDWMGWMAGLCGCNARSDRSGDIEFKYYSMSAVTGIGEELQYDGGAETSTIANCVINSLTSGTEENAIISGSGIGITFTNPYMTKPILDGIYSRVRGLAYRPIQLHWRGNPALECGDTVSVQIGETSVPVFVMAHKLTISGGLEDTIYCYGSSEEQAALDTPPTVKRIQAVYDSLQQAIIKATGLINGAQGGIFAVTDNNEDGINDGWLIKENDSPDFSGKCIVANYEGIGFSHDGGNTYSVAITTDGSINADYITTGSLNAERVRIGGMALTDSVYVGRRRPNDPDTPMVMRIGVASIGGVQEIMGNRTAMYRAEDVQSYIDGNMTEEEYDLAALYYQTPTEFVMQRIDNFKLGNMRMRAQLNGGVSFIKG